MSEQFFSQQTILLQSLLMDLEAELRRTGLWSEHPPPADAFASEEPFCVDTMEFAPWLQFVFMVRLQFLIKEQQALPTQCGIAPYAEMYWQGAMSARRELLAVLQAIDQLLTTG
jgi:uncharacterized protein YqcC (DUF446 family)